MPTHKTGRSETDADRSGPDADPVPSGHGTPGGVHTQRCPLPGRYGFQCDGAHSAVRPSSERAEVASEGDPSVHRPSRSPRAPAPAQRAGTQSALVLARRDP
ncbi:hypothetical protein GCM10009564_17710 [Streptomyces thermogriseus]|uniref:Uncharacterized protein n=1 Tax=Streptomyces thermogriseus TaxID=75292 RepID=A0ABP4DEE5_9ACTN